jgi:hypothetical protein
MNLPKLSQSAPWHRANMLEQENIKIVAKADKPSNLPQARLIENVWALLARAVYAKEWEEKNKAELCGTIERKLKEIDVSVV